jgi:CubicO group peptidase (beta-lactamase class C family)
MERELERQLDKAFQAQELAGLHSVLIIHQGDILAEKYFPGNDANWGVPLGTVQPDASSLHDLRSVTKSITSMLYGIALDEGSVPELDESLIAHFPEYGDLASDAQRRKMLVRHALTMQMGIEWNEDLPYTDPRNSEIAMELAVDRYRYVLGQPIVSAPGCEWVYNGGAAALIAGLITRGTGKPLDVYAREKLFTPLGIETFDWHLGSDGVPSAASGLRLNVHDMAKIAELILKKGRWEGKQIISADWLEQSLTPQTTLIDGLRYGYYWFLAPAGDPPHWFVGAGNGGQRLYINPGLDLIVVIFAGNYNHPDDFQLPMKIITEFAVPAVLSK